MIEELWQGILDLSAQFVIPDWGSVVALIPVGLAAIVVLWFVWTVRRLATAGPTRRGKSRITPITPPGVHAGHSSLAPLIAAGGAFAMFAGLVLGGVWVLGGGIVLTLALLYWGREAQDEYEQIEPARERLPAVVQTPPPGVHLPGPSFRPLLGAIGTAALFLGLIVEGWILAVSALFFVIILLGWLRDARAEYVKTEEADRTGHLESLPAPGYPTRLLGAFGVFLLLAAAVNLGWLPPQSEAGGEPGGSPAPTGDASGPPPSGEPGPGPTAPAADVVIHARGVQFVEREFSVPADTPFTIGFVNEDANIAHNVEIKTSAGESVFMGEIFNGVDVRLYEVPALAAGTYPYICTVHPNMTGTATVGG